MLVLVFSFFSSTGTLRLTASGPLLDTAVSQPLRLVGIFNGLKVAGLALAENNHQLVAVGIGVGTHEGRVLLLVYHHIMHGEAAVPADEGMFKARQAATPGYLFTHHPYADTARPSDAIDCSKHFNRVE